MSKLHFSENLFVDNLELRRFNDFIFEEGWQNIIKNKVGSFGVVRNLQIDSDFNNFKVTQGNPLNGEPTIVVNDGTAIGLDTVNDDINVIRNDWNHPIIFPNNGKYYWVKISYENNPIESGVCSIDIDGNLVGVGTEFTKLLRGQPNFPQVVRFYRLDKTDNYTKLPSGLNPLEYTVAQVIDDENAILQGDFANENSIYYEVVGTFTPGYIVPDEDKGIYRKDGCLIELVEETSTTGFPLKPFHALNEEFFIYRVKFENGQMIIEDFRNEVFKLDSEFDIEYVPNEPVPHIGLTKVSFSPGATKEYNNATVEWGFFSNSYDVFVNEGKLTITSGAGGKFKTANDFQNGDFDRYRLYVLDQIKNEQSDDFYSSLEKVYKIKSSQKNGTSIDLLLENFSPLDFIPEDFSSAKNYTNKNKVTTSAGTHRLMVSSLTGVSPVQSVYNNGAIYSINQFVTYLGGTFRSLTNSNSGNTPDANPSNWELVWEQYKSELVIVPDCEDVILSLKVGEDVDEATVPDQDTYIQEQSYPAIIGRANLPIFALNGQGSSVADDLVYNIQYRIKNNKAVSSRKVLPSDAIGYTDEVGTTVPYDTTFVDNAFVKAIRSASSVEDFVTRIDIGNKRGWQKIDDLEPAAASLAGRTIPIVPGTDKERIIIESGSPITADIWFDLATADVKSGNTFEFHFSQFVDEDLQYVVNFIQNGATGNILATLGRLELRQGDYVIRFLYDEDEDEWSRIVENNSFQGFNHFTPGPDHTFTSTSTPGVVEVAPDGNNILVVEGDRNVIIINDDAGVGDIAYLKFKNGRPINELYICKYGQSSDVNLIKDGDEARNINSNTGDEELFAFNSANQHDTNNTYFNTLNGNEMLHMIIGRAGWNGGTRQGYHLIANSNDRQRLATGLTPLVYNLGIGGEVNVSNGHKRAGQDGNFEHTRYTLPNNGRTYTYICVAKQNLTLEDNDEREWYRFSGRLLFNGSTDITRHGVDMNDNGDDFQEGGGMNWASLTNVLSGTITLTGQNIRFQAQSENSWDFRIYDVRISLILIPIE